MEKDTDQQQLREDLDKDIEIKGDEYVNMEGENRSTATEGVLKPIENDKHQEEQLPQEVKVTPEPPDETKKTTLSEDESLDQDEVSA